METEAEQPGSVENMINALEIDRTYWREQAETHENIKSISKTAIDLTEQRMDERLGKEPLTRKGQEALEDTDITRFRRFRNWAEENLVGLCW